MAAVLFVGAGVCVGVRVHRFGDNFVGGLFVTAASQGFQTDDGGQHEGDQTCHQSLTGQSGQCTESEREEGSLHHGTSSQEHTAHTALLATAASLGTTETGSFTGGLHSRLGIEKVHLD